MVAATSYGISSDLKKALRERAASEGVTETALVTRLLDEGLRTANFPGIVYRPGPSGRRAALAAGADVWEVVLAVRSASGSGMARVADAAEQLSVPPRLVMMAIDFAAVNAEEIEADIARHDEAAELARRMIDERERLFGL